MDVLEPGDLLEGKYRVLRQLGAGGIGAVYEAEATDVGRRVCVKTLQGRFAKDATMLARFRREARTAAAIHHPNIVAVSAFHDGTGGAGSPPFLVMDLIEGQTLHALIRQTPGMDPPRVVRILAQILDALEAAHGHGVVHRDLKPHNVMLTSTRAIDDFVHVLDFGLAGLLDDHRREHLTMTGQMLGTPGFMAPEQVEGQRVDVRSDVFAVGVIGYVMLTGKLPFGGETGPERLVALLENPAAPLRQSRPDVDAELAAILHCALEKEPSRRHASASAMRTALSRWARRAIPEAAAVPATAPPRPAPTAVMKAARESERDSPRNAAREGGRLERPGLAGHAAPGRRVTEALAGASEPPLRARQVRAFAARPMPIAAGRAASSPQGRRGSAAPRARSARPGPNGAHAVAGAMSLPPPASAPAREVPGKRVALLGVGAALAVLLALSAGALVVAVVSRSTAPASAHTTREVGPKSRSMKPMEAASMEAAPPPEGNGLRPPSPVASTPAAPAAVAPVPVEVPGAPAERE